MSAISTLPQPLRERLDAYAEIARVAGSAVAMCNLGTVHLRAGDSLHAELWFRDALRLDPHLAEAHQNLAALLQDHGRADEAQHHRDRAFRHTPLRIETAPEAKLRVLVLSCAGYGNIPIENLLPRQTTTRLKLFVEYATEQDWETLPDYDAVFNAVGDADLMPSGLWQDHIHDLGQSVINKPSNVARTRRDRLYLLLADIPDIVVPRVIRRTNGVGLSDLNVPILVRPLGAHGGQGLKLLTSREAIPPDDSYVSEFHDYRSADGFFRKYRVIFVDRVPFPYHLAISPHWMVHYFSADMREATWKRAEEGQFLANPAAILGDRAMAAVGAIGQRLDLDYAGIDFGLLPDGRMIIFEANATMAVHLDDCPIIFDYKRQAVPRIFDAFQDMLKAKTFSSSRRATLQKLES